MCVWCVHASEYARHASVVHDDDIVCADGSQRSLFDEDDGDDDGDGVPL